MTYLLLGALPIEATLHIRTLHLLGRVATNKDSVGSINVSYRRSSLSYIHHTSRPTQICDQSRFIRLSVRFVALCGTESIM